MRRRYLSLEGANVVVDEQLISRMPPALAAYYLAVPLAAEDGSLSVAMAHPDNETALAVLADLFGSPIVPVRLRTDALHGLLRRLYNEAPAPMQRILCWSAGEQDTPTVDHFAAMFAASSPSTVNTVTSSEHRLQVVLDVIHCGEFDLAVLAIPPDQSLAPISEMSPASLLLLLGNRPSPDHALVVLRGYASDGQMLERLAPLLHRCSSITLLPLLQPDGGEGLRVVPQNGLQKRHLHRCLHHDVLDPACTFIRFRQGAAVQQVVDELRQEAYDLVAISAEGSGHFVSGVLSTIERQNLHHDRAFFILKPPAAKADLPAI